MAFYKSSRITRSLSIILSWYHLHLGICFVPPAIAAMNADAASAARAPSGTAPRILPRKRVDTTCQLILQIPESWTTQHTACYFIPCTSSCHCTGWQSQMISARLHKLIGTPLPWLMDVDNLSTWFFFYHLWQENMYKMMPQWSSFMNNQLFLNIGFYLWHRTELSVTVFLSIPEVLL